LAVGVEVRTDSVAAALAKRGILTAGDLLETPPRTWRDYSEGVTSLADVVVGAETTVRVELLTVSVRPTRRRNLRIVEAHVRDESGAATAIWFNQGLLARTLQKGQTLQLRATVRAGRGLELTVREHEVLAEAGEGLHTSGVVAVYDASRTLSTRVIRELVEQHLPRTDAIADPLPVGVRVARRLPLRRDAIASLHAPQAPEDTRIAGDRLAYEELLLLQVALAERRAAAPPAEALGRPGELLERYRASLPFTLTLGQKRSVRDIDRDLARGRPMRRLLLGDVGSGKTVVAVHAMLRAAERGAQAALLAPTEVLVQQHAATVRTLVEPLGIEVAVVTGDLPAAERRVRLQRIASGDAALVVGTHALLEKSVEFAHLSVIVVDEQHRFGVEQRASLSEGHGAHSLHMTATPIPRSLALSLYGDLDLTELRELPAGRQPIITRRVRAEKRADCHAWLVGQWQEHRRQAYVVCPLVEGSETVQARAAEELHVELVKALAPLSVGVVHGRQKAAERLATMRAFAAAEVQVLVATTVIEVGIDVPNATAMVIEDADRFGLSQLHQLRGRVGRSSEQSYCFLFESPEPSEVGQRRLVALCEHASGFDLAVIDLRLRGEGELAGLRQSGASDLRHTNLARHRRLIARSRADARLLARAGPFDPVLAQAARERFGGLVERIGRA
ncbi:MAG: ATP-dependent helicase RecG, partial [Gaiellales bacterium]|nr:ATP-dependent helicase RecG [Gaiellales bacterium]